MKPSKIKTAKIKKPNYTYLNVAVYIVQKCNFNDEFLVEHKQIPLEELNGRPLSWIDPYLGRREGSHTKIAVVKAKGKKLYYLEDKDGILKKRVLEGGKEELGYTQDHDERTLISPHLGLTSYKY